MSISRRQLLERGIALAVSSVSGSLLLRPEVAEARRVQGPPTIPGLGLVFHSPRLKPYVTPLPVPPRLRLGDAPTTLAMRESLHRFHRDLPPAPAWGYGGATYLGPTLEARAGTRPIVRFDNQLGAHILAPDIDPTLTGVTATDVTQPRVSVHLHGAPSPPIYDGNPMLCYVPGQSLDYQFQLPAEATTLWYHDHAMGITRLNQYAGLAAQCWVRDDWDTGETGNPLGLPAGEYEWPLVFQDRLFYRDGRLRYYSTPTVKQDQWQGGFLGDVMCVNGAVWPNADVARGLYRFRILNGSSLATYNLSFSNGMRFWVIGSDGGLLDAPAETASLQIDTGERFDVLVDFSGLAPGETVELLNNQQVALAGQLLGSKMIPNLMQFTATSDTGFRGAVPRTLRGGVGQPSPLPALAEPETVRTITLVELLQKTVPFVYFSVNNLMYEDRDIELPRQGSVEQWDIVNTTSLPHPLHIHLVQFRVLGRSRFEHPTYRLLNPKPPVGQRWAPSVEPYTIGQPFAAPEPWECGWRDTIRCPPFTVTRLLIRFPTAQELGFDPDAPFQNPFSGETMQGYTMHCHLGDHEDHEMMLRYRIVAADATAQADYAQPMCRPRGPVSRAG